jgi:hypothetical protein
MEFKLTRRARLVLIALAYLTLVVFAGLRWETGNDWFSYYNYYNNATSLAYESTQFEIGYRIFVLVAKSLQLPYSGFLLIYSAAYLGLFVLSFIEADIELAGWMILGFYCTYLLGLMGTNRQVMAMAICLYSIRYVRTGKWWRFVLGVAVAACFHISAVCFLIVAPLARVRLRPKYLIFVLTGLTIAGFAGVGTAILRSVGTSTQNIIFLAKIAELNAAAGTHVSHAVAGNPALHLYVKRGLYLLLFIVGYRYLRDDQWKLYLRLFSVSVAIVALLYGVDPVIASRLDVYFSIFEIFLLALFTREIKTPAIRTIYSIMLLGLLYHGLWTGVYSTDPLVFAPYKGIFINQNVWRDPGWFS